MKIYRKLNGPAFTKDPTPDERAKMEVMRQAWLKLQKAAFSPEATAEQEGAYEKARKQYDDYVAKFTNAKANSYETAKATLEKVEKEWDIFQEDNKGSRTTPVGKDALLKKLRAAQIAAREAYSKENAIADSDKAKLKELKAKLEKAADGTDEEFKKAQKAYDDFMDTVKTNKNNSLRIFRTVKNAVAKFGEGDTVRWRSKNYEIIRVREETLGGQHLYDIESETNTVTRVKEAELQEIHLVNSLRIFRK